ncbi:MAG: tetratricopeptide repeat protein [Bryobacteraceae bacterium]|nr:tetratricopeptide repeat protein [Bryobacteraceae bacterium]
MKAGNCIAALSWALWMCVSPAAASQASAAADRATVIEKARESIANGSAAEAVRILKPLTAADPGDADAHLLLGAALALIPRRSESLDALRKAVELRPDSAQAQLTLGMALARFSEPDAARQAYEKAVSLDPSLVMAHVNLGVILAAKDDLPSAVEHFTRAIELDGDTPAAARYYYLRGKARRQQDRQAQAARDFERAAQLDPANGQAYLELGVTRADLEDQAGALAALEKAAALAPNDAEARYQLGALQLRTGQAADAVKNLQHASGLRADDRNILYALARALRATGRMEEAKPLMERLSQSARSQTLHDPDVLKAGELNNEGVTLEKEGRFAEAMEKYRAAVAISPREISFRRNLALALCRLERWKEAVVELKQILRVTPGDADATKAYYIALEHVDEKP